MAASAVETRKAESLSRLCISSDSDCIGASVHMCSGVRIDMCIDMCIGMRMGIYMRTDMWLGIGML